MGIGRGVEEFLIRAQPVSLTDAELDVEHHPIYRPAESRPVRVWVRFPETVIRPECEAIAWTDRAVQVRWTSVGGIVRTAWVWRGAIEDGWGRPSVPPRR